MDIKSRSQGDHCVESSKNSAERRVTPRNVIRDSFGRQQSQEASQREAPSLIDLTLKNFKQLKPEHFQNGAGQYFLQTELADGVSGLKEWNDWLHKHFVGFFDTPEGSKWFEEHGPEWLCNTYLRPFEKSNIKKLGGPDSEEWKNFWASRERHRENLRRIFNTEAWKKFVNSEKGSKHLDSCGYQMFHELEDMIRTFVNAPANEKWIKSNIKKYFASGDSWLINNYKYVFETRVGKMLINSEEFDQWIKTETGKNAFNKFIGCRFMTYHGIDFLNKKSGLEWLKSEEGYKFMENKICLDTSFMDKHWETPLNDTEAGKYLIQTKEFYKWLDNTIQGYFDSFWASFRSVISKTEVGKEMVKTKEFCEWLDTPRGERFLSKHGLALLNTETGNELIQNEHFWKSKSGYKFIDDHFEVVGVRREVLEKPKRRSGLRFREEVVEQNYEAIANIKIIREGFIKSLKNIEEGKNFMKEHKLIILPSKR